ncbi:Ig-like domain-containing protein [Corynebacterium aquatimens]|uniref:Ig-like domain (Group 3) n=1 Tax=Corynebacterium aquatimens TaxID=1190508 RepID=A0A931E5R1_9CORY|nr:Ig-like domain-containing protein [Corynebacterium aquatimens]MBG6122913.1 hypothetical protein [Corynebacterium aquatimens]WJY66752.1 hypothetical protein CAQUA_10325 [Corynebacterium aquatimens]
MAKRFPIRTAIAGLTALAVIAPVVTPANTTILSAAVAQAQQAPTVALEGPNVLAYLNTGAFANGKFTATVPGATSGTVVFYLDNKEVERANVDNSGKAEATFGPKSFGQHTVTARYVVNIDNVDYNPYVDGTKNFDTPLPQKVQMNDAGLDGTNGQTQDLDTYSNFGITKGRVAEDEVANVQTHSTSNPLALNPGDEYTIRGRMTVAQGPSTGTNFGRYYEYGFNPPVGSTYIDGTAKKYNQDGIGWDYNRAVFSVGTEDGVDQQIKKDSDGGSTVNPRIYPVWGQTFQDGKFPKINQGYVGLQTNPKGLGDTTGYRYDAAKGYPYDLHASFVAPDTPGVHIPQYASFKYRNNLHVLEPMYAAAFKIEKPELPPRRDLPAAVVTLDAPASAFVGETVQLKVTADAKGTVQLYDGTTKLGDPIPVEANTEVNRDYSPGSTGTKNVRAVFAPASGVAKRGSETSRTIDVKAAKATTLSLTAPQNAKAGRHTITATVAEKVAGKVEFFNGDTKLGEGNVNTTDGTATWTGEFAEGTHNLRAKFTPSAPGYTGSEATHSFAVGSTEKTDTSVEIVVSKNPATAGEQMDVTVNVTPNVPGKVILSNSKGRRVELTVDGGKVSQKYTPEAPGEITISAEFVPSVDTHNASASNMKLTVNAAPVSIKVEENQTFQTGKPGTLTATISPSRAEGTMTFFHNGRQLGDPVSVTQGRATLYNAVFNSTDNPTVEAVFTPAPGSVWAENKSEGAVTINQAPAQDTKLTLTATQGKKEGETVTLTATVSPKSATGSVKFYMGTESSGAAKVDPATGQATISGTRPAGTYSVRAEFTPDNPLVYRSSEATTTVSVGSADKSTPEVIVTANPAKTRAGQQVQLSATMNPASVSGSIVFYADGDKVGEAELLRGATKVNYTPQTAGAKAITAEFVPDASSESAYNRGYGDTTLDVEGAGVRVTMPTATIKTREKKTFYADVRPSSTIDGTPADVRGTVTFSENGVQLGEPVNVINGRAAFEIIGEKVGEREIVATFTPNANTKWSPANATGKITVEAAPAERTRAGLDASPSEAPAGENVTFTASVSPYDRNSTETIQGTFDFYDGTTKLNENPVDVDVQTGTAVFTTSFAPGSRKIKAVFTADDPNRWASSEADKSITVTGEDNMATSVRITAPRDAFTNEPVTIKASASPSNLPGKISFLYRGVQIAEKTVDADGNATIEYAFPEAGTHQISAIFTPSKAGAYGPSREEKSRPITVKDREAATTELTFTPPRSAVINKDVKLSASVTPDNAQGTVVFYDGDTEIGRADTDGGTATITHSFDRLGEHPLRAVFTSVDKQRATDAEATATYPLTVINEGETFGVETAISLSAPASVEAGKLVPIDIRVAPNDAKGTVELFDGDRSLGTVRVSMGRAKKPISLLAGSHTIRAVFTPDDEQFSTAEATRTITATGNGGAQTNYNEPYMTLDVPQDVRGGDDITVTAVFERADIAGRVEFYNGNQQLGAATVENGKASQEVRLPEGTHNLRAVFTPANPNAMAGTEATVAVAVGAPRPITPQITATASAPAADGSQTVTLRSKVKAGTRGKVRFTLPDGTLIGEAPIQADGTARWTHTFPEAGKHEVIATVLDAAGNPAGPETKVTVNAGGGAGNDAGVGAGDGDGDGAEQGSSGSSLNKTREEVNRTWKIVGIVSGVILLIAGLLGFANHPGTKAYLAQFGIRY